MEKYRLDLKINSDIINGVDTVLDKKDIKRFCPRDRKRYKSGELPCATCNYTPFFGRCNARQAEYEGD